MQGLFPTQKPGLPDAIVELERVALTGHRHLTAPILTPSQGERVRRLIRDGIRQPHLFVCIEHHQTYQNVVALKGQSQIECIDKSQRRLLFV